MMDRYLIKKEAERAFKEGEKYKFSKSLRPIDMPQLVDVLWDYIAESDSSYTELENLRKRIRDLNSKSGQRVRCMSTLPNRRALIQLGPIKEEIMVSPNVNMSKLVAGVEVLVIGSGEGRMLAEIRDHQIFDGHVGKVQRVVDTNRVVIESGGSEIIMCTANWVSCREGDEVRYEPESKMVLEVFGSTEQAAFTLDEVPDVSFEDVKGLEEEKRYLNTRLIYPIVYREHFEKHGLKPIRAALFHGSAGCGKTMLAKAVFNEMLKVRRKNAHVKGESDQRGFFLINGPEVLNKWAGNTENTIRKIFKEARILAKETGFPSVIFWDEIESITGKRKDSSTYTPEKTVVPTLLSELQGLKSNDSVVLIGATNRPDLIDPALMRPGRLGDAILEIPRPEREAALEILNAEFIRGDIPKSLVALIEDNLKEKLISHIYNYEKPIASVTLKSGKVMPIMRQEQVNGALFTQLGEEIIRDACIAEIEDTESMGIKDIIELSDNIMLNQIGVLDAGAKSGFTFNTDDYVLDISLNS
jgi:proteasome-associated ATPase